MVFDDRSYDMNFLPKSVDPKDLLNCLREINLKIIDLLGSFNQISANNREFLKKLNIKNSKSGPVTDVDIKLNEIIIKGLNNNYPNQEWEILSEENNKIKNDYEFQSDWVWIIDPLDGTKDFINNTGEYAVHIALTFKSKVILSNVLIPHKEESWFFLKGLGSWGESKIRKNIPIKKINSKSLEDMVVVISRNHCPNQLSNILERLKPLKIIGMGSIGYKVISIIKGEADLYISFSDRKKSCPKDWDIAAPESIIRGFNGFLTNENAENLELLNDSKYRQDGVFVASMSKNHLDICKKIKDIIA